MLLLLSWDSDMLSQPCLNRICMRYLSTSTVNSSFSDVVVLGGGLVGAAFACANGSCNDLKHLKTTVLESGPITTMPSLTDAYSNRVSAISPGSLNFFESIGILHRIKQRRLKSINQLRVFESCSDADIHFENSHFSSPVTHIVENNLMVGAMHDRISELDNVDLQPHCKIAQIVLPKPDDNSSVVVRLADGSQIECSLLIGADGGNSLVRKTMNTDTVSWNYGQNAVVATLEIGEGMENDVAWQKFTPNGPVALLPLSKTVTSLVWSTTPDEAKRLLSLSDVEFVDALNEILWDNSLHDNVTNTVLSFANGAASIFGADAQIQQLPPTIVSVVGGSRAAFPLGLSHSAQYVGPRVALIGDAAHRVHPLAGQGVNLGFRDIQRLISELSASVNIGRDLGSSFALVNYERGAQAANVPTMAVLHSLNELYRNRFIPLVMLRSLGLNVVNQLLPIKDLIVSEAAK